MHPFQLIQRENIWKIIETKHQIFVINLKFEFNTIYAPNLLSVWQIHFEFEHFNATVPISVISMKNYQISLQLNFKLSWSISIWIQCNISTKFTRRLTNTPRIWTFHCSFPYISHFHLDLPNNIATKLQMNSDQSEIWFSEYLHQIYWVFDKYTSNLNISMQLSLYQSFLWRTTKYHCN